jgi:hypothetical protein
LPSKYTSSKLSLSASARSISRKSAT